MNNSKRERIQEALRQSKRLGQIVSLLKSFEEGPVAESIENCVYLCKLICSILDPVLTKEVISHSNVPRNLSNAENSRFMRIAMSNVRQAKEGYSLLQTQLESFRNKCGQDDWSERFDRSIDWEIDVEGYENLLKQSL